MILMAGLMLAATLSAVAADSSLTNDLEYLKKKWRTDVTDESGFACRLLQDSVIL